MSKTNKSVDKSKNIPATYSAIAEIYSKTFTRQSFYLNKFIKLLPEGAKVLDAGCGAGVDVKFMIRNGLHVEAFDLAQGMIDIAQKKVPEVKFWVDDIRTAELKKNYYDAIVLGWVLHHIPKSDIQTILSKISLSLKREGAVYVAIQEGPDEEVTIPEPFDPKHELFLNIMSEMIFAKMLQKAGFKIVKRYMRKCANRVELSYNKLVLFAKKG